MTPPDDDDNDTATATTTVATSTPAPAKSASGGAKDPLHGVTLEAMVTALVEFFGWEELGARIPIRCFQSDPSMSSSLKFLRKTPWAREKVEGLYLFMGRERARRARGQAPR